MLFGFFLVCSVQLGFASVLLVLGGARVRFASRSAGALLVVLVAFASGQLASYIWSLPSRPVEAAEILLAAIGTGVVVVGRAWNPLGQLFFGSFVAAALAYLAFAADITVAGGLSIIGSVASAALFLLELAALVLAASFAFETCDVICRVFHTRDFPEADRQYHPKVSLHIAAYNEPPEMLIETIRSAEQIDYPDFEVVVVDNNTRDPDVWTPVREYCRDRPRVRFVHVEDWPGFKSGALNLALADHTHTGAEIVGVIDADYLVEPDYLKETVGFFADPNVAFVQTPQDYRDYEGSAYFTACYDAYRYFFATAMPSRNERNSIIFAGTMGLLRRSLLESIGGWDEWCITEDAETSLRLLMAGYSGMFIARSFGKGIMPLTFSSLKSQRFRWCFGGMQILRRHWRKLMPWDRSPENRLSVGQRLDYLFGGLQWMNDLVLLGFSLVLLVVAGLLLAGTSVAIRPLIGPTILLPGALLASGLLRAVWALRRRTGVGFSRALLAFSNWLSLSLTVARACLQGLTRSEGVFMRTPKSGGRHRIGAAISAAGTETVLAALLWSTAIALSVAAHPTPLLVALLVWQGSVYLTSPYMSWLSMRAHLSPELEQRRRTEELRERLVLVLRPAVAVSSVALGIAGAVFVAVMVLGASHAGHPKNPFSVPQRAPSDKGPWGGVLSPAKQNGRPRPSQAPSSSTSTTAVNPAAHTSPTSTSSTSTTSTTSPTSSSTTTSTTSTSTTTTTTSTTTTTTTTTTAPPP